MRVLGLLVFSFLCAELSPVAALPSAHGNSANPVAAGAVVIDVKDFGAKGDGSTDDSAAVIAAFAAAEKLSPHSLTVQGSGGLTEFGKPPVFFPAGVYNVSWSTPPMVGAGMTAYGNHAIIHMTDSRRDIFMLQQTGIITVEGLSFWGGRRQLTAKFGDVGDGLVTIRNCEFMGMSGAGIYVDNDSNSTSFVVEDSHFYLGSLGGIAAQVITSDSFEVRDCYIGGFSGQRAGTAVFILGDDAGHGTKFMMEGMSGGPGGRNETETYWFDVHGPSEVHLARNRFGGEHGGMAIVKWEASAAGGTLFVDDCATYHTPGYLYEFYSIPGQTRIRNSGGNSTYGAIYFDPSITQAMVDSLGNTAVFDTDMSFHRPTVNPGAATPERTTQIAYSTSKLSAAVAANVSQLGGATSIIEASDFIQGVELDDNGTVWGPIAANNSAVSGVVGSGPFGEFVDQFAATAAHQYFSHGWKYFLRGIEIEPGAAATIAGYVKTNVPINLTVQISAASKTIALEPGEWIVDVPFVMGASGPSPLKAAWAVYDLPEKAVVDIGTWRAFLGDKVITTPNTVVYSKMPPSASNFTSGRYLAGDRIVSTALPASGKPQFWSCVASGRYAPAWRESHQYKLGDIVSNDSTRIYWAASDCNSADSGGPAGTGGAIADNTCSWRYIDATPKFIATNY